MYRYGFNGKEKDDDFGGSTSAVYDYGFRIYDSRIGKFLSVDPLTRKYPNWSPYPFAMNRPIDGIDLDGLEWSSAPNGNTVFKAVIVNTSSNENINLYCVRGEMEKQFKGIFGKDFEIQIRVIYDKSKLKVAKDEAKIEILDAKYFSKEGTTAYAHLNGRYIAVNASKIDYYGQSNVNYSDGTKFCNESSFYAEEIGHTGGLQHPFELRDKGQTNRIQMWGVDYGNFMSYPQNDVPEYNVNLIISGASKVEDNNTLMKKFYENPQPATFGQKTAIKLSLKHGQLNKGKPKKG